MLHFYRVGKTRQTASVARNTYRVRRKCAVPTHHNQEEHHAEQRKTACVAKVTCGGSKTTQT